jgi:hypothetical protein
MDIIKQWRYLLACINIIIAIFLVVSFIFVLFSVLNTRFYSPASLIITFGAGGVLAAVFSYYDSLNRAPAKNELTRWSIIITMVLAALLIIFFLSPIQGREYESAFTSFGSTLGFSSLLFMRGKMEV